MKKTMLLIDNIKEENPSLKQKWREKIDECGSGATGKEVMMWFL